MEKVKDQKDDVKSENEVFEAESSSSFSGFGFNQLSDPLVFPNYGAEPEAHAGHLEKVFPCLISIRFRTLYAAAFSPANTESRFRHPLLLFRSPVLLCTSP